MKKIFTFLCLFILLSNLAHGQTPSPSEFLNYELGTKFTYHHRVISYFKNIAQNSNKVKLLPYGQTYEGRDLLVAVISSPKNIQNLEEIRKTNLINTGLETGTNTDKNIPIIWLSYNVHGNEAVSSEVSMKVLYELISSDNTEVKKQLENLIIIIDPCLNPDGRERYVNWYNQIASVEGNPNPNVAEHQEPFPTGRPNHYLFDLNRDWAWQTQIETQQRMTLYQKYMPQIHVDFHEMSVNSPYFFAPATAPFHEIISDWQREFQTFVGQNNAKYFDENGWLYYTKENFDLLYPSYGDTYPIFNGGMGFTYEQGGSGRAGLNVLTEEGDTLRLKDRLEHHFVTSLATLETANKHSKRLLDEFKSYFNNAKNNPSAKYKTYIIKNTNPKNRVEAFLKFLDKQQIKYAYAANSNTYEGFDYLNNCDTSFEVSQNDILISAYQAQSNLLKVLLEPKTVLNDSVTYDLTSWALPYAYNLEMYACESQISKGKKVTFDFVSNKPSQKTPYAFISEWRDVKDAHFLASLLKEKVKVRFSQEDFKIKGKEFKKGSLIITKANNKALGDDFEAKILAIANREKQTISSVQTGFVGKGKDFGSNSFKFIKAPKVAMLRGEGVNSMALGDMWYFFEQELKYPIHILSMDKLSKINLNDFDLLILPSGNYAKLKLKIQNYVGQGGKVIALEKGVDIFTKKTNTNLSQNYASLKHKQKRELEDQGNLTIFLQNELKSFGNREREAVSNRVLGAIYKISLDQTHPLAFGQGNFSFLMKRNKETYPLLTNSNWNVGIFGDNSYLSGFIGSKIKNQIPNTMAIGVEKYKKGQIIYFSDSPILRGFWHSGKLFLSNAIFFL